MLFYCRNICRFEIFPDEQLRITEQISNRLDTQLNECFKYSKSSMEAVNVSLKNFHGEQQAEREWVMEKLTSFADISNQFVSVLHCLF